MKTLNQNEQKEKVGKVSIDTLIEKGLIFSGMKIGLGTGSTAMHAVKQVAARISDGTLKNIKAVSTSFQTTIACQELGIPVFSMNSPEIKGELDLAIDGADEIDVDSNLIKGGGAALLLEKIVAYNSKVYVIITDESKAACDLGTKFALPVEIIPEARVSITKQLEALGAKCVLREGLRKCGPVITDNGNFVIDAKFDEIESPSHLEIDLNSIPGVVENGIFSQMVDRVIVGTEEGTKEL